MKREFLLALETIETYQLGNELDSKFPSVTTQLLRDAFNGGLLSEEQINSILRIAPPVYIINKSIFLRGEESDVDGDLLSGGHVDTVIELFDITEEIRNGHSYSFYVTNTSFFELGTANDVMKVRQFFEKRK